MAMTRLSKLRLAKYSISIGSFSALAVAGVFTNLPDGSPLIVFQPEQPAGWALNTNAILPLVFAVFGLLAIFKDQIKEYFKFPAGINVAILLFLMGFLGWLISYWLMASTGLYLILTIINTLYFNPSINDELKLIKDEKLDKRKKERVDHA